MIIIIVFGSFILLSITIYLVLQLTIARKMRLKKRLENVSGSQDYNEVNERNQQSFYEKMIKVNVEKIGGKLSKVTPKKYITGLDRKLHMAGVYPKLNREKWLFSKFIVSLLLIIVVSVFLVMFSGYETTKIISIIFAVFIIINILNYLGLSNKITTRKKEIQRELPDTIDLITVSVEAGLSFDSAVSRYVNSTDSDLSNEFKIMLKEMRLGIKRKKALKNLIERCDVDDLSTFIGAIIQANELGVSITNILRIQSKIIRDKRKQRAREKSMKAPIKLLFPLLIFIFPTIFLVLLGPVIIQLLNM
jgi:tight adherence protein C